MAASETSEDRAGEPRDMGSKDGAAEAGREVTMCTPPPLSPVVAEELGLRVTQGANIVVVVAVDDGAVIVVVVVVVVVGWGMCTEGGSRVEREGLGSEGRWGEE